MRWPSGWNSKARKRPRRRTKPRGEWYSCLVALTAYIYNSNIGQVLVGDPVSMSLILESGNAWHGLFHSTDEIARFYNQNKAAHPEWKKPTGNPIDAAGNAV